MCTLLSCRTSLSGPFLANILPIAFQPEKQKPTPSIPRCLSSTARDSAAATSAPASKPTATASAAGHGASPSAASTASVDRASPHLILSRGRGLRSLLPWHSSLFALDDSKQATNALRRTRTILITWRDERSLVLSHFILTGAKFDVHMALCSIHLLNWRSEGGRHSQGGANRACLRAWHHR